MYKLLIVDDEPWSRRLIREVIDWKSLGFKEIDEAQDGQDALNQLQKYQYALMIMDMRMPGMDGVELLSQFDKTMKTKIIIMSGYDDFSYLRQALKVNAIDYLLKPIIKSEIERAVKQALTLIRQESVETNLMGLAKNLHANKSFVKYLNLKNQLYGSIIEMDEASAFQYIEVITTHLNEKNQQNEFRVYVYQDLKYMIEELKEAHISQMQAKLFTSSDENTHPMDQIAEQIKMCIKLMRQSDTKGKLYIEKVVAYVDAHYTKNITLESLSGIFFISKEHLSRAFKTHTAQTMTEYVNKKRIIYAQQLIAVRGFSPKTTAAMSGFTHLHYFYRVFKIQTGMTPIQYAESHNINIVQ